MDDGDDSTTRRSPPIPLIKDNHDGKLGKDFVKIKPRKDPSSPMSDLHDLKMSLFDNDDSEDFCFVCS